jgi:very-short-patch-repair endonuclease
MAIDNALRRELISLAELHATVARLGRSGRNGVGVLRSILELRGDRAPTDSEMETMLLDVVARNDLPVPTVQFTVLSDRGDFLGTVDAAYPDAKLAIEYESYEHHIGRLALVQDSARRNELIAIGWTVITATAVDLQTGGRDLCRAIRACLERHQPDFGVAKGRRRVLE